jgi:hypothetical protein
VSGIERRQRGLDAQQEEVQAEIAKLLSADWFSAVDRCQALLDATTSTLRELNEILLRDTHHFIVLLQEIQTLALAAESADAEATAQRVIEHVDRIAAWGATRQRTWSDYYQYVHRYLRDVVRLDPDRALSQRLRDQLASWPSRPFHLVVAHAASIRLLRACEARVERPPVARPRADRERTASRRSPRACCRPCPRPPASPAPDASPTHWRVAPGCAAPASVRGRRSWTGSRSRIGPSSGDANHDGPWLAVAGGGDCR